MIAEIPRRSRHREPDPKYMTLVEHLEELRRRLIYSILAIALGSVAGWYVAPHIIHIIHQPLLAHLRTRYIYTTTPYGGFTLQLKVALIAGFAFALPVTIYQVWAFVAPAFGRTANRWAPAWMSSCLVLFLGGAATGYFILPIALAFLTRFQSGDVQYLPLANDYINFVLLIAAVFGISFELPLALVSLAAAGIVTSGWLASKRLYAFFVIFAFATVVTPGTDLVSPLILGGILYVLYEGSIVVSRLMGK